MPLFSLRLKECFTEMHGAYVSHSLRELSAITLATTLCRCTSSRPDSPGITSSSISRASLMATPSSNRISSRTLNSSRFPPNRRLRLRSSSPRSWPRHLQRRPSPRCLRNHSRDFYPRRDRHPWEKHTRRGCGVRLFLWLTRKVSSSPRLLRNC